MDEADLLSLMDKDEVKEYTDRQDDESREDKLKVEKATKENSSTVPADSASAPEETKTKEKKTPSVPIGTLVLLVLTGHRPDPDADYLEGKEEDYLKDLEEDAGIGRSIHCSP